MDTTGARRTRERQRADRAGGRTRQATRRGGAVARLAEALGLDLADDGVRVGVLGPLVVRLGSVQVELRAEKQRSVLGLLALHAGEVVSRDRIVDALWSDRPPASWRNLVHTYVARLRGVLSRNAILGTRGGYRLGEVRCDVAEFDDRTATARRQLDGGDLGAAEQELRRALGLWRGPVLGDLPDRVRADPVTVAITGRRTAAALTHADVALRRGRFTEAVTSLWPVVHDQPWHEPLHAKLIVALAGDGQLAASLKLFERIRSRLADELGIQPGQELRAARQRVLLTRTGLTPTRLTGENQRRPAAGAAGNRRPEIGARTVKSRCAPEIRENHWG